MMTYRVTVLTPTLVGDGSKLSPIDYMVWRDQVNVLDQTRIFKLLSKGPRLEGYLTQLRKATKLDFASWGGFAQNYAGRRIPFEDAACASYWDKAPVESLSIPTFAATYAGPFLPGAAIKGALRTAFVFANVKPSAIRDAVTKVAGPRPWRHPAEQIEHQTAGSGGSDRLRVVSIADSARVPAMPIASTCSVLPRSMSRGPQQYSLGWKQAGRGAADGKRPEDGTPTFAEMAAPGTSFEGIWRENAFLNREEVRQVLHWSGPVTRERLFESANKYAEKQLDLHTQYAQWTGWKPSLRQLPICGKNSSGPRARRMSARHWMGRGFLSKSSIIGANDEDYRSLLGSLPYYERAIKSGLPFPKTRRVIFLKNKPATLPGWVELGVQ